MTPRDITTDDLESWGNEVAELARYTAPGEADEGIEPCPAINLVNGDIAVAWQLDEIDVAHLAKGGTLWLVTRGYLPVHSLFVQPAKGDGR